MKRSFILLGAMLALSAWVSASCLPAPSCSLIPNTSIPVGAGCFGSQIGSCPLEVNPQNPVNFGADSTGVSDSSVAIATTLNSGDVMFSTPGTYLINLTGSAPNLTTHGIVPPAGRKIECGSGVTLKTTTTLFSIDAGEFSFQNNNNVMCGCTYVGPQTGNGPMTITSVSTQNDFIAVSGGTGHIIEGNTISRVAGNSAIQLNLNFTGTCPTNVTVQYNTFSLIPYYSVNFDCQVSGETVNNNLQTDGDIGAEWDACPASGNIGTGTFKNNEVMVTTGNCSNTTGAGAAGCHGAGYLSNFSSAGSCNYSGITFGGSAANANYCAGLPGTLVNSLAAHYENAPIDAAPPAVFSNNIIGSNCSCTGTSPC